MNADAAKLIILNYHLAPSVHSFGDVYLALENHLDFWLVRMEAEHH